MLEDVGTNNMAHGSPSSVHGSPCSFERFLWEWNAWLAFSLKGTRPRYEGFDILTRNALCHTRITEDASGMYLLAHQKDTNMSIDAEHGRNLLLFNSGDWRQFSRVHKFPLMDFMPGAYKLVRIWDSPPEEDPKPRAVEMTQWKPDEDDSLNPCGELEYKNISAQGVVISYPAC
jgi:hypothetical protein